MEKETILIVEDDLEIKTLIQFFLEKEDFFKSSYNILTTQSGMRALQLIKEHKPSLIVLDLMLPEISGLEISKIVRNDSVNYGTPLIFMLTAKTEVEDVITGFEAGCDDYLRKPFDPRELILRLRKIITLTEKTQNISSKELFYNEIKINLKKHIIYENDVEVILSNKEFSLLVFLIENRGIALSRETILNKVWKESYYLGDRTIDVYIGKLREKIPSLTKYIKTIKGVGYKLKEI